MVQQLFVPTVAALVALVIGVSALGDEREDGTILYLVATPMPRVDRGREGRGRVGESWCCSSRPVLSALLIATGRLTGR